MKLKNVAQSASSNVVGNGGEAALKKQTEKKKKQNGFDGAQKRHGLYLYFALPHRSDFNLPAGACGILPIQYKRCG